MTRRVIAIARALRHKGPEGEEKRKREYRELLRVTRQIVNDARRVLKEAGELPRQRRSKVGSATELLETVIERARRVIRQMKARVFDGMTQSPDKIVSMFEPHPEIIRKRQSRQA